MSPDEAVEGLPHRTRVGVSNVDQTAGREPRAVGLVVPHAVRLFVGPDHRVVLPASAVGGAAFLVLADAAARLLFRGLGAEPPVGAVTAVVGAPLFVFLLRRRA